VPAAIATSAGLAYDRVSSRFVVADARQRKLQIIDERSHRVMDLVTSASAGFFGITGFEIDDARGDLWVVSAESAGAHDGRPQSALHKIQLVSGRPIERVPVPEDDGPCRLVDVAVTPSGTVFVLDAAGRRLLRFQPATRSFATVAALNAAGVTSLAAPGEHLVYVAGTEGIIAVDTATGVATPVPAARGVRLATIERLRWAHDSLLAIQRLDDGTRRSVRFRLARGRAVSADVIDTGLPMDGGAAATLSGDDVYVAVRQAGSDGDEIVIRRSRVR
jgi:streptogramin lyase